MENIYNTEKVGQRRSRSPRIIRYLPQTPNQLQIQVDDLNHSVEIKHLWHAFSTDIRRFENTPRPISVTLYLPHIFQVPTKENTKPREKHVFAHLFVHPSPRSDLNPFALG